jgi:hypothetical protein
VAQNDQSKEINTNHDAQRRMESGRRPSAIHFNAIRGLLLSFLLFPLFGHDDFHEFFAINFFHNYSVE